MKTPKLKLRVRSNLLGCEASGCLEICYYRNTVLEWLDAVLLGWRIKKIGDQYARLCPNHVTHYEKTIKDNRPEPALEAPEIGAV